MRGALVLVAVAVAALIAPVAIDAPAVMGSMPGDPDASTGFSWNASDPGGNLSIRLTIEFPEPTRSHYEIVFGVSAATPVAFWLDAEGVTDGPSYAIREAQSPGYQKAHVGPIDTRHVFPLDDDTWGVGYWGHNVPFDGTKQWALVLFEPEPAFDEDAPAVSIDLACDDPFQVLLEGGRDPVGATLEWGMADGAGASVTNPIWLDTSPAKASVVVQDSVSATFDDPSVALLGHWWRDGAVVRTTLALDHPNGQEAWTFDGASSSFTFEDGPGEYQATVDHVGVHPGGGSYGLAMVLAGFEPVDSLDELLG